MRHIDVMVNGLPGNMAGIVASHVLKDARFNLVPFSLTGQEILQTECIIDSISVKLIRPDVRDKEIAEIIEKNPGLIMIDYTHPSAVNMNAEFYVRNLTPFVMGTTGGDRKRLLETVNSSAISAVIAPNMAKQIVGFQAMMDFAATAFTDLFKGYSLDVRESHQKGKADTSGTAKAVVASFNQMGVPFAEEDIRMERNPDIQKNEWGVPEQFLSGHGWHTYTLTSEDKTVKFEFTHNVNGRDVYAIGTLDAAVYLSDKIKNGIKGKVFSMIDVLKSV